MKEAGISHAPTRILLSVANRLPPSASRGLGRAIGLFWFHVLRIRRRHVERNIARAIAPQGGRTEVHAIARANFIHYGLLIMEVLRLRQLVQGDLEHYVEFHGLEHIEAAVSRGKGVLGLTAHLGNYDLMAVAVALRGYPVTIISKPLRNKRAEAVWMGERAASGLQICLHRRTMRDILGALRANRLVGFVLDQHASADNVWVDFFGRPASTLRSVAVLAMRTGAPVLPMFTRRRADGRHDIVALPALDFEDLGDAERSVIHNTRRYVAIVEDAIRATPSQWTWIHRRWKPRPEDESAKANRSGR